MIRINLLPTAAVAAVGPSIRSQLIAAGAAVLLSLLGIFFLPKFPFVGYFGVFPTNRVISDLEKKIKDTKIELEKVQAANKLLAKIKKSNKEISNKLKIIQDIEEKRTGPVWLMDEMTDAISHFKITDAKTKKESWKYLDDKVFINSFDISGNNLSIDGIAINNTFLVAFLNNLKRKKTLFKEVKLYFSDQANFQGARVRKFKITAKVELAAKPGVKETKQESPDEKKTGEGS